MESGLGSVHSARYPWISAKCKIVQEAGSKTFILKGVDSLQGGVIKEVRGYSFIHWHDICTEEHGDCYEALLCYEAFALIVARRSR